MVQQNCSPLGQQTIRSPTAIVHILASGCLDGTPYYTSSDNYLYARGSLLRYRTDIPGLRDGMVELFPARLVDYRVSDCSSSYSSISRASSSIVYLSYTWNHLSSLTKVETRYCFQIPDVNRSNTSFSVYGRPLNRVQNGIRVLRQCQRPVLEQMGSRQITYKGNISQNRREQRM